MWHFQLIFRINNEVVWKYGFAFKTDVYTEMFGLISVDWRVFWTNKFRNMQKRAASINFCKPMDYAATLLLWYIVH